MKSGSATRFEPVGEEHRSDHVLRASLRPSGGSRPTDVEELVVATKVRRPLLPRDLVARTRLLDELEAGVEMPLMVVAAPAGYGKTTLVSHWLERAHRPSAWVSLGEEDDDLEPFVLHLVAAMRQMSPASMTRVTGFIREGALPSPGALGLALLNDLSDVDYAFVLVLDGTESIRDRRTLQLLSSLLEHPPAYMHLVLVGRWDPFLATASRKVAAGVAEIRARDLRFTPEETRALLEISHVRREATPAEAESWTAATEGWITGLKLAIYEGTPASAEADSVRALTGRVRAYIQSEVIAHQPDSVRRLLLDASILDRFCEPLCRALCDEAGALDGAAHRGLQLLRDQGLFLVPLDASGEWFRFHGLLRDFLTALRQREGNSERDAEIRRRAAMWFAEHGLLEEAVWHALRAGDPGLAGALVEERADRAMAAGAWGALARAVQRLPADVVQGSPQLLLVSAWVCLHLGRLADAECAVDRAMVLAPSENGASLCALHSALARARGNFAAAIDWARTALASEGGLETFGRGMALTDLYAAHCSTGDWEAADSLAEAVLADTRLETAGTRERLLSLMCAMRWRDGDLTGVDDASARCERLARAEGLPRGMAVAELYRGLASYERNDLPRAREHLSTALAARGVLTDGELIEARYGLARVHRAQGRHRAALEMSGLHLGATDVEGHESMEAATWAHRSLHADLALAYGEPRAALGLVDASDGAPADLAAFWLDPRLTLARALLLKGDRAATRRARDVLTSVDEQDAATRGGRFRLEWHCLGALLAAREGDAEMGTEQMHEALTLAERAGFLRYFVDLGPALAELLKPFARHPALGPHARRVLAAYYEDTLASGTLETSWEELATDAPYDLLTPREAEILRLLSKGLANNEIAEQSFVSVDTVKTHLKNIYRKLNVQSRRQAVSRARAVGLLAEA